jgi:glycosyltransferase involved in cell wall biosynthesis
MSVQTGPIPILFTHFGDQWFRGSETLLLDLMGQLDRDRFRPVVWCNGDEMARRCRDSGLATTQSEFRFYFDAGSPRFSPRAYLALVRQGVALARRHGIRVLHANSAAPSQWLLPVARQLRLPLLSHLHISYLRRSRFALLTHQADLIVGVSAQVLEGVLGDGVPQARTAVIYNGVEFARLGGAPAGADLRARLGIDAQALVVGSAGSLIRRKGHDILIRALAGIGAAKPPHLLIAGDGPEHGALRRQAEAAGMGGRVHVLGHLDPITDLYRACDIVALASRGDSFALVLAEAGYAGLPVVATRVGGIPEVVAHEETGLLVPPDDPDAMMRAIGRLAADPGLRRQFGEAGRQRATERFSAQRMAGEFGAAYDRLAALPPGALGWSSVARRLGPYGRLPKGAAG